MKNIFTLVVSGQMTLEERNMLELRIRQSVDTKFMDQLPVIRSQEFDIKDDAPVFLKDLNCGFCNVGGVAALEVNEFIRCPTCGSM